MKLLNNMIVFSSSEYKQLSDKLSYLIEQHEEDFNNLNKMYYTLSEYKKQLRIANKNTKKAKDIIKRNRKYLEKIIDDLILPIYDENKLQKYAGLSYGKVKEEMLKYYDKPIK